MLNDGIPDRLTAERAARHLPPAVERALGELRDAESALESALSHLECARTGGMGAQLHVERARKSVYPIRQAVWRARALLEAATTPGAGGESHE